MVDIILIAFCAGVFYGGFWLGAKYQTLGNLWAKIKERL